MRDRLLWLIRLGIVTLLSSVRAAIQAKNLRTLNAIYGAPLAQLDQQWQEGTQHGNL